MKRLIERFLSKSDAKKMVTVEIVAYCEIDADAPDIRLMLDKNMKIPIYVAPTSPTTRTEELDVDVYTIQWRITRGRAFLHDKPKMMPKPPSGNGGGS